MEKENTPLPDKNSKDKDKKEKQKNLTVEQLAEKYKILPAVLAGVKEQQKWFPGKTVEETEFKKAVETFFKTPQGTKRRK